MGCVDRERIKKEKENLQSATAFNGLQAWPTTKPASAKMLAFFKRKKTFYYHPSTVIVGEDESFKEEKGIAMFVRRTRNYREFEIATTWDVSKLL